MKLIAFDLDDTLLNDEREISDENAKAIQECADRGIYIVLCSGRAEESILPYVRRLEIAGKETGRYIIAMNGSSIFDLHQRKQIFCRKVESDILLFTDETAKKYGLVSQVYTSDRICLPKVTKWSQLDSKLSGLKMEIVENYREFLKEGFTKMVIPGEPAEIEKLQKVLKEELKEKAVIFTSKPYFLEILPPDCGKGEAVHWLSDHTGFGIEKCMGFGDSMNDESLIRKVKYGVAMCNGLPQIKALADFVTEKDNNHDGIAEFLRKYIL